MSNAIGARRDPLLIAITTAGVKTDSSGGDSIAYRLYQYGQQIVSGEIDDPSFMFAWWGATPDADPSLEETWYAANPALGDLIDIEDLRSLYVQAERNGTVSDLRTKRLNQFVTVAKAWLPQGAWEACRHDFSFSPPSKGVVLGLHGSRSGDSTALVAVTVEADPKVRVIGAWERPVNDTAGAWKVPRAEVKETIRQACRDYQVREISWGEFIWQAEADELEEDGLPVVVFPQTPARMSPATQRAYEMINAGRIWHNGDPGLSRHLSNAQVKTDQRGTRLIAESKASRAHLAFAMVIALDRAAYWLNEDGPGMWNGHKVSELKFVWLNSQD